MLYFVTYQVALLLDTNQIVLILVTYQIGSHLVTYQIASHLVTYQINLHHLTCTLTPSSIIKPCQLPDSFTPRQLHSSFITPIVTYLIVLYLVTY